MKKIIIILLVAVIGYALYYLVSPIFNTEEVNDAVPTNIAPTEQKELMQSGFEELSEEDKAEMVSLVNAANETMGELMNDPMDMMAEPDSVPITSQVQATFGHPAAGNVRIFDTEEGQIVRLEDFMTIDGPQLHVYLSKDLGGEDFIDLGPIKGTVGNINYKVPEGVDLSEYKYIMHWCVPFGVLFNYAELS